MNPGRALVLGWKDAYLPELRELDHDVVFALTADDWQQAAKARTAHPLRAVQVRRHADVDDVVAALHRAGVPGGFQLVHTDFEFAVVPAAVLGAAFGAAGLPVEVAVRCRDKWMQKEAVRAGGIPVADTVPLGRVWDADAARLKSARYPAVIKPVNGAATSGTFTVRDSDEARRALAGLASEAGPRADSYLLEPFVDGAEHCVDGIVRGGRVEFVSVSRYLTNVIDAVSTGRAVAALIRDPSDTSLYDGVRAFAQRVTAALGLRDSVFHMELFETPDGWVFSELGARSGGGWLCPAIEHTFGVTLEREAFRIAFGRPLRKRPDRTRRRLSGWVALPAPAGRLFSVPAEEELGRLPGVIRASVTLKADDLMPDTRRSSMTRIGAVLVEADDEDELRARMLDAAGFARSRTKVIPA